MSKSSKRLNIESGNVFGSKTVIQEIQVGDKGRRRFICLCKCGKERIEYLSNLIKKPKGCRCRFQPAASSNRRNLHAVWSGMKKRCYDNGNRSFQRYGGRGIKITTEWLNSFENFYQWSVSSGYAKGLSIERKCNDSDYSPGNCCWIPHRLQARNRSSNKKLEINGEVKTLIEWSEAFNIPYHVFHSRLKSSTYKGRLDAPLQRIRKNRPSA